MKYLSELYMREKLDAYCHKSMCFADCKIELVCGDVNKPVINRVMDKFLNLVLSDIKEVSI